MRTWIRRSVWISLLLANMAAAAPPAPVAIVSDTTGSAYVISQGNAVRVTFLSELQPGQVLQLEPGSRVVVAFVSSGSVFELAGAGRFRIGTRSIESLDPKNVPRKRDAPASTPWLAIEQTGAPILAAG